MSTDLRSGNRMNYKYPVELSLGLLCVLGEPRRNYVFLMTVICFTSLFLKDFRVAVPFRSFLIGHGGFGCFSRNAVFRLSLLAILSERHD